MAISKVVVNGGSMSISKVVVIDANNLTVRIDRGVAGRSVTDVQPVEIDNSLYLEFYFSDGTTETVGPVGTIQYIGQSPIVVTGSTISLSTVPVNLGGTGVTTSTGTGSVVLNTNPTLNTYVNFTPTVVPAYQEGRLFYDSTAHTLTYYNDNSQMSLNIGQENVVRVKNQTGSTISEGTVVYVNGATGNTPTVSKAIATAFSTADIIGVATTTILNNEFGYVTTAGLVNNLNTSAFTEGQAVFVSATTAGAFTATEPIAPNYSVQVGVILRSNPNVGTLLVSLQMISTEVSHIVGILQVNQGGTGVTTSTGTGSVVLATSPTLITPVLGTPSSVTLTNATGLPISTGVSGLGTGVATFLATPSSANLRTAVTDETGTGALVFATSPTLVTPALGTPSALVGTNITGTAAGLTAGSVTTNANLTGAVTSVGNATSLGSFTSAQLAGALTNETGSGSAVFATSPTLVTPNLGTPSTLVGTNITGTAAGLTAGNVTTNANLTGAITSTGNATSLGSFTSAQLAGALTDETGSGLAVFATSPTLVTPALGTPSSATLSNATGLPISTGVSGLGTGVATALAVNVGTAGSPVVNGGVLGTPSSGTLTNATGLPIATGVSGLGTGVATFLATPSSANLAAAVTGETGTGALVFATSPTLVTPALGTPSSGVVTNLTGTASININGTVGATTPNTGNFTVLTENASPVVVQTDIGTAPNEIPLNQYLGNLAYQDAANIAGPVRVGGALTVVGATTLATASMTSAAVTGAVEAGGGAVAEQLLVDNFTASSSAVLRGGATNLLTYSEQFDNAAWTKTGGSITANTIVSPDGTVDADKLIEDTSTGVHQVLAAVTLVTSTTYAISVFAKAETRSLVRVAGRIFASWSSFPDAVFNLSSGTVTSVSGTGTPTITSVGNGWYRCVVFGTTSATNAGAVVGLVSTGTTSSYTGDGTSGLYIWGAQLEAASTAGAYLKIVATAVSTAYAAPLESPNGLAIPLLATMTPARNEDMTFELASNTSLVVKVRGSDGIVRSATLTLA